MPSRSSSTSTRLSVVARLAVPTRPPVLRLLTRSPCCRRDHRGTPGAVTASSALRNAVVSGSVPAVTRRCPGRPTSRTSTPRSSRDAHADCSSTSPPKSTKLASLGTARRPSAGSSLDDPVALLLDRVDRRQQRRGVGDRGAGAPLASGPTGGRAGGPVAARRRPLGRRRGSRPARRRRRTPCSWSGSRRAAVVPAAARGRSGCRRARTRRRPRPRRRRRDRSRRTPPRTTSSSMAVPVGLLGEQMKTTSGSSSRTCSAAAVARQVEVADGRVAALAVHPGGAGDLGDAAGASSTPG